MYADGRLLSSESSGVDRHSDVLAKLIADGLADSCSQVLASRQTSVLVSQKVTGKVFCRFLSDHLKL